jgi:hypothetical protein
VLTALVVAQELAGVDISDTPAKNYKIPGWIIPAILNGRKDPSPAHVHPPESIWRALAHPWQLPSGIRKRWPSPITAAIMTGAPFEVRSPLGHQICYCARLIWKFVSRAL